MSVLTQLVPNTQNGSVVHIITVTAFTAKARHHEPPVCSTGCLSIDFTAMTASPQYPQTLPVLTPTYNQDRDGDR